MKSNPIGFGSISRFFSGLRGIVVICFILTAFLVDAFFAEKGAQIHITQKLQSPSSDHFFGTDALGRDLLTMILLAARNSILIAVCALSVGIFCGVPLGFLASIKNNGRAEILDGINDFVFAFPPVILAILISATYGSGAVTAILAIGIFNIPIFARVTKTAALPIWREEYVLMAQTFGKSKVRIFRDHVLRNIFPVLLVQANIQFPMAVLGEAALGYLGLSIRPPAPTWGKMLFDAQSYFELYPHLVLFPGIVMILFIFAIGRTGDSSKKSEVPQNNFFR